MDPAALVRALQQFATRRGPLPLRRVLLQPGDVPARRRLLGPFLPAALELLTAAQHQDGSWDLESIEEDREFGNVYTTSLACLALEVPYQMLPIYQR